MAEDVREHRQPWHPALAVRPPLALSTALLAASSRPFWSLLPAAATVPVAFGWMSIQLRLRRDQRLEQMPGSSRS